MEEDIPVTKNTRTKTVTIVDDGDEPLKPAIHTGIFRKIGKVVRKSRLIGGYKRRSFKRKRSYRPKYRRSTRRFRRRY